MCNNSMTYVLTYLRGSNIYPKMPKICLACDDTRKKTDVKRKKTEAKRK